MFTVSGTSRHVPLPCALTISIGFESCLRVGAPMGGRLVSERGRTSSGLGKRLTAARDAGLGGQLRSDNSGELGSTALANDTAELVALVAVGGPDGWFACAQRTEFMADDGDLSSSMAELAVPAKEARPARQALSNRGGIPGRARRGRGRLPTGAFAR